MKPDYEFHTTCINSTYELIIAMRETALASSYEAMRRRCAGFVDKAVELGYERDARLGLTLKRDRYVAYNRGTYGGRPCYFLQWSGIEYVWVKR